MSETPLEHVIDRYRAGRLSRRTFLKRATALGLSMSSVSLILDACGAGSSGSSKELHLLMEEIDETNFVEKVLPQFTKETGIKVSIEKVVYEAMHDKLVPQLSAGPGKSEYDLIQVDVPWTKEFVDAHWLLNLSDYLNKSTEVKLSEFIPSTVESNGIIEGQPYMVPFYHYAYGFMFRRDVLADETLGKAFEKQYGAKWEVPTTLQDFERLALFISAREGRSKLAGTVMLAKREENGLEWMNYLYANGGDFTRNGKSALLEPEAIESLEIYGRVLNKASQPGANDAAFNEGQTTMEQGKGATWMIYLWMQTALNTSKSSVAGKIGLSRIPGKAGVMAAWGWAIPTASPKQQQAWELLQYLASYKVSLERALMGSEPVRPAIYENPEVLAKWPEYKEHYQIALHSKIEPVALRTIAAQEALSLEIYEATSGKKSAKAALEAFSNKFVT